MLRLTPRLASPSGESPVSDWPVHAVVARFEDRGMGAFEVVVIWGGWITGETDAFADVSSG
jgi:hypothetical protein